MIMGQIKKLLEIVLFFGVFVFVVGEFFIQNNYAQTVLVCFILSGLVLAFFENRTAEFSFLGLFISSVVRVLGVFFCFIVAMSLIADVDFLNTLKRVSVVYIGILILTYFILNYPKRWEMVLIWSCTLSSLLAIYSVYEVYSIAELSFRLNQIGLTSRNPNVAAIVLGGMCVTSFALAMNRNKSIQYPSLLFYFFASVILFVALLTQSRTVMVGVLSTIFCMAIFSSSFKVEKAFLIAFVVLILVFLTVWLFGSERLVDLNSVKSMSNRLPIWMDAISQIQQAPWFGYGFDADLVFVGEKGALYEHPHNRFLWSALYFGWVGFLFFIGIYLYLFLTWLKLVREPGLASVLFPCLFFYGLLVQLVEVHSFITRPNMYWFLIWAPFSLLAAIEIRSKSLE